MRITKLKLKNFIGIKNGLGLDEFEVTFPKNGKIITMLTGSNGSGKSTIMSQLTPYKDSFDDRKTLIIPGKEGYKEIVLEHNNHEYVIKHYYGKKPASFISEDGNELNTNGGVRTFEEILKQKFKLDKDYFNIGKMGSNTTNFIQFTPTVRKAYISTFVEAVEKYLSAYEIVSKKYKLADKQINQIVSDLSKFESIDNVKNKIKQNELNISLADENITKLTEDLASTKIKIDNIEYKLNDEKYKNCLDYAEYKKTIFDKEKLLEKNKKIEEKYNLLYKDIPKENLSEEIEKIKNKLSEIDKLLNEKSLDLKNIKTSIVNNENELLKITSQLNSVNTENINVIKNELEDLENKKSKIENEIINDDLFNEIKEIKQTDLLNHLNTFKTFILTLLNNYSALNEVFINNTKNINLFFRNDFTSIFNSHVESVKNKKAYIEDNIEKNIKEQSTLSANENKLLILEKRPKECTIDACPFIADALKYLNLPEKLLNIEEEINRLKESKKINENEIDKIVEIKALYQKVSLAYKNLTKENIAYKKFTETYGNVKILMDLPYAELNNAYMSFVEMFESKINKITEFNEIQSNYSFKDIQYKNALKSENTKLYFENEKLTLINENIKNQNNEKVLTEEVSNLQEKQTELNAKLLDFTDFNSDFENINELEIEINNLKEILNEYENLILEKKKLTDDFNAVSEDIKSYKQAKFINEQSLISLKSIETTINQLQENIDTIEKEFNNLDSVKKALNPKSGIPLVFIQSYLDTTEYIANELLKIAFNGKFEIKFIPSSNDFFIQVKCDDIIIDDIKSASQGQIAMTSISISLALIERSLGDYNIVYLDEIDGQLDTKNRESFINILNKQIEKLGLEQVFVISHNNVFDSCSMNLIRLKGSPEYTDKLFLQNKEILYDATE